MDWAEGRYFGYGPRRWLIPKRRHGIINCQKMAINMLCLLMCPIIFWKTIRSGTLLYGFPGNMSQKLWKKKADQAILQKKNPSSWLQILRNEKSGQQSLSTLTLGWWQTGCYGSGGKSVWAAALWQDIAAKAEDLPAKVHHGEPHIPKSHANEEHQNHEQVNQAARKGDDIPTIWKVNGKQSNTCEVVLRTDMYECLG